MNISVRAQDVIVNARTEGFVRLQLKSALDRLGDEITSVEVFLKDDNGPKGGIDKHVSVRVRFRNRRSVIARVQHESMHAAIVQSVRKTRRVVRRHLRRSRRVSRIRLRNSPKLGALRMAESA